MRATCKGLEGGTCPILASHGETPDPHQLSRSYFPKAQRSQKMMQASSEGAGLASASRTEDLLTFLP